MDGIEPKNAATGVKSAMKRPPFRRRTGSSSSPLAFIDRRQSEPTTIAQRRASTALPSPKPVRPQLLSHLSHPARTVSFRQDPFESHPMVSLGTPSNYTPSYPALRTPDEPHASLFGVRTRFRPLWLLGIGNVGLTLFSLGEVLIQRAIWPVSKYEGLNAKGPTIIPGGAPGHGNAFGSRQGAVIAGSIFMAVGVGAAVTASVLFMHDGRRLNRAQNSENPNYRRTHTYFAAHLIGIAILVVHKFVIEAYRTNLPVSAAWATALPGGLAQSLFAVTQAQSFSSSELANGRMPLKHRGLVTAAARSMVASYIILGAMVGTPNVSAYGRESIRMVTAISTNLAYSMPLTSARLAGPAADVPVGTVRYRGDWSAIQAYTVYIMARLAGTISSFWLSRSRWPAAPIAQMPRGETEQAFRMALTEAFRGLPAPLPSLAPDWDETIAASILMTISFAAAFYSFLQFHRDSPPPYWHGRMLVASATASVLLGLLFRAMQERAKNHADFELVWFAVIPGFTAQALAFFSVVELFAQSEHSRGNIPIPYRYQVIEACRFTGGLCWYLWAAMGGLLGFPPIARQMTIWAATSATILGFALPNADTLRAARGATPRFEVPNPFER